MYALGAAIQSDLKADYLAASRREAYPAVQSVPDRVLLTDIGGRLMEEFAGHRMNLCDFWKCEHF